MSAARHRPAPGLVAVILPLLIFYPACTPSPTGKSDGVPPISQRVHAARDLRGQGRGEEAVAAYDSALRSDPRDSTALLEVVALLLERRRPEEARARAQEILKQLPVSAVARLALAQVAYRTGDRKEAGTLLDQAASHPADPRFYPPAARLYHLLARTGRGVEILEGARTRGLADAEMLGLLGDLCLRVARPKKAEEAYRQALKLEPDSLDFRRNLGRALLMLNRRKEAEEALKAALRLDPQEPYTLYYLGTLRLEGNRFEEAVEYLSRSLRKDPVNPKARYALARALLKLGRSKEAEAEFQEHARLMERLYHHPSRDLGGRAGTDENATVEAAVSEPWDHELEPETGGDQDRAAGTESRPPADGPAREDRFYFVEVAESAGIRVRNVSGGPDKDYIVESLGSGACWLDYDADGLLDLFVVNGRRLAPIREDPPRDTLYRNRGDGTFADVTVRAGIRDTGWGHGCAAGDIDNDGDSDLYVTNRGPNGFFRNNGNGTFSEIGRRAGVDDPGWSTSAAFADYDGDGFLDLAVANYVKFDPASTPRPGSADFCRFLGMPVFCGPRGLPMAKNRLYRNRGNGTFEDVTARSGFHTDRGYYSLGLVWGDVDDDGHPDLYVATDSTPNLLYRNDGDGTFTDVAVVAGVAYSEDGREQAGMGTDLGDYDNDGDLDIVVTNFSHDVNTLYRQDAAFVFSDVSYSSGIGEPSLVYLGWGVGLVDLDNDGWKDLFVANGHVQPQIDRYELGSRYRQRNLLFVNRGSGTFEETGPEVGPGLALAAPSRGAAFADFDNDGDLDIFVNNIDETPSLLRNDTGNRSHWVGFKLEGTRGNRDAVGARVTLTGPGGLQVAEVHPAYSYLSSNDPRILFGLGRPDRLPRLDIRIRWPDGSIQELEDPPIGRYTIIKQP